MSNPSTGRYAAVVLAAGASSRLGYPKQLILIEGESLLRRTIRLALEGGCAPVFVVLGFEAERMRRELDGLAATAVLNGVWREGMGSSLRRGAEVVAAVEPAPDGVLLLVCDQPQLSVEHLRTLLLHHAAGAAKITASEYGGKTGVPAVFAIELLPELLAAAGDQGARELIRRNPERVERVAWPGGEWDIDRPEDTNRIAGK